MRNSQSRFHDNLMPDVQETQVLVNDIVRYLSALARLYAEEKTGNQELSLGLRHLVKALRPYSDSPISELSAAIAQRVDQGNVRVAHQRRQATLPVDLESLGQSEIERILKDDRYTKQQVAELGSRRFGISRSKLERLRKVDALQSVRAALEHELSLDVISEEARKGGRARAI